MYFQLCIYRDHRNTSDEIVKSFTLPTMYTARKNNTLMLTPFYTQNEHQMLPVSTNKQVRPSSVTIENKPLLDKNDLKKDEGMTRKLFVLVNLQAFSAGTDGEND